MLFSPHVSARPLLLWCRALRHGLHAGLSPVRVFRQQAKSGPAAVRPVAGQLADRMAKGSSLVDALGPIRGRFPVLFLELVAVGEETGRLAETFAVLEDHYKQVVAARRDLLKALVWPAMMFAGATVTITLLLFILGVLPTLPNGDPPLAPFGKRMVGPAGALTFLAGAATLAGAGVFVFLAARNDENLRGAIEGVALPVPGLGGCFRAFALYRFAVALHMSAAAGLRHDRAVKLGLRATANRAYSREADRAGQRVRAGAEVAEVLAECGPNLFPEEFVSSVQVGEESGQLAEVMDKLADQLREESVRKLKLLMSLAGGLVYLGVAVLVVVLIFKLFLSVIGVYNDALAGL